jgi:hypothetical protein
MLVLFIVVSWFADRLGLIDASQKAIWRKTPGYHEIIKLLEEIKENRKE